MKNEEDDSTYNLGPCCVCEKIEGVRNILMLDFKSPIPGHGWGCFTCNLPQDGSYAVVCDECLEKPLKFACNGYPATEGRIPIEELTEKFDHDYRYHQDQIWWFTDSPDPGSGECICSFCHEKIDESGKDGTTPIRITNLEKNVEARFHQDCFEKVKNCFS